MSLKPMFATGGGFMKKTILRTKTLVATLILASFALTGIVLAANNNASSDFDSSKIKIKEFREKR